MSEEGDSGGKGCGGWHHVAGVCMRRSGQRCGVWLRCVVQCSIERKSSRESEMKSTTTADYC